MEGLIDFFADNACLLFLTNGLAFFTLGLAIALETRRASTLPMGRDLWLLSGYGFAASLGNLLQMYLLNQDRSLSPTTSSSALDVPKLLFFILAGLFLLQFGVRILVSYSFRLRWLPIGFWALAALYAGAFAAVLLSSRTSEGDWLSSAEVWARYLLHFPALALAAVGLLVQRGEWSSLELNHIARDSVVAGSAFGVKMAVSGLAAVPILGFTGPPMTGWVLLLQSLRVLSTGAIAYFVVRTLRASEFQRQRQLAQAIADRFEAQEQALRSQQQACDEIQEWSVSTADMVQSISMAISQPASLEETMRAVLQQTIKLAGLQAGAVFLLEPGGMALELIALEGLPEFMVSHLTRVEVGDGLAGWVAKTGELLIVEDIADDPRPFVPRSTEFVRFVVGIPLKAGGQILGVMNLSSLEPHELTRQQVALLTASGHQLGVAIQTAQLSQRVRYLATTEERSRLSREIHDNLAQLLGYLNLKASDVMVWLSTGKLDEAGEALLEVKRIAQEAYADARETIFSLRAPSLDTGLLPALQAYLEVYFAYYGIPVDLSIGKRSLADFSPDVGIQVSCIIQEALTNVRRHAGATKAWLTFEPHEAGVRITIADNGQGFDVEQLDVEGGPRFGLSIMRERAESVAGSLKVNSRPGEGTGVILWVPCG